MRRKGLMMRRRSKLGIIVDILEVLARGSANVSQLMLEANLSYTRLVRYLEKLEGEGLVSRAGLEGREVKYGLTRRGEEFLREFRRIRRITEAFGIEL